MMLITPYNFQKATVVSRKRLESIPLPKILPLWKGSVAPDKSYWQPLNHGVLSNMIVKTITEYGLKIVSEKWILCMKKNLGLLGDIEVKTMPNMKLHNFFSPQHIMEMEELQKDGMTLHILCRHSNNARWALHFLAGAEVSSSETGIVMGKFGALDIRRKHSRYMGLRQYVHDGLLSVFSKFDVIFDAKMIMQNISLTDVQGDHIIIEAGLQGVIPWRYIPDVAKQWRKPKHACFRKLNAWSLYNCFAEVAKRRTPRDMVETLDEIKDLMLSQRANGEVKVKKKLDKKLELSLPSLKDVDAQLAFDESQLALLNKPSEDLFEELDQDDEDPIFSELFD